MNWKKNIYIYIYKIEDDVSMKEKENSESINRLVEIKWTEVKTESEGYIR